jgi:hypothetical protein
MAVMTRIQEHARAVMALSRLGQVICQLQISRKEIDGDQASACIDEALLYARRAYEDVEAVIRRLVK